MSVISRYKKKGGFIQLLQLVETSGISKQEKFLSLIEEDSPNWGKAVREKLLTIDRLMAASDEGIQHIFSKLKILTIASASFGFPKDKWERILSLLDNPTQKKIQEQIEVIQPSDNEISNSIVQIFSEIRRMTEGESRLLSWISPEINVNEAFENELLGTADTSTMAKEDLSTDKPVTGNVDADDEIFRLRKKVKDLQSEVDRLKSLNLDMKSKIDKIIKIAA